MEPVEESVDVVVIGAGMGGATVGYELARLGKRVLFLEKGRFVQRDPETVRGDLGDQSEAPEERLRRGYWPQPLQGEMGPRGMRRELGHPLNAVRGGETEFFGPLGCGTGGSTILYGATLERFFPCDFRPRELFPEVADSTLPEAWPIGYDDLEPYYRRAEELFRVRGTPDPLHPSTARLPEPPALNEQDQDVFDLMVRKGLHPYRIHIGCRFVSDCDGCAGRVCLRDCKSDSGNVCIVPAVERHGAKLLTECEVTRLEADRTTVRRVHFRQGGRERSVGASIVVLAAGALMSPILLLDSKSELWPQGLANGSGLVGRNLMVHSGDMIAVRSSKPAPRSGGFNKSLSISDLYFGGGRKLGNFQSVGVLVDTGSVLAHLQTSLSKGPAWLRRLAHPLLLRVLARVGAWYFRNSVVFGSIVEDLPYLENRVLPDPTAKSGMRFEYRYTPELAERNELFRRCLARALGWTRVVSLTRAINLNFGHLCGTIRFGDDPATSVLRADNRAHEVENLYVVDGSFFPSSGGTNPSLTIAANALRVAEAIAARLAKPPEETG